MSNSAKHHGRSSQLTGSARRSEYNRKSGARQRAAQEPFGELGADETPLGKSRISFEDDAWSVTYRDLEDAREYAEAAAVVKESSGRFMKQRI